MNLILENTSSITPTFQVAIIKWLKIRSQQRNLSRQLSLTQS